MFRILVYVMVLYMFRILVYVMVHSSTMGHCKLIPCTCPLSRHLMKPHPVFGHALESSQMLNNKSV
jgi:hypothetical protein